MAILGEVFSIIRNGASIKQIDGANGFPITRIETISNRVIDRNRLGYANVFDITEYESYVLQSGDILMSHINSEKHLGKTALYIKKGNEKIIHGMNLLMLRANSEVILPLYAKYFFDSNLFLKQIPNITKKSVNQASFTVTALKKLEIKIPQMVEQKRIIDIMSRLDNIIQYRKDQLEKLDLFVKSRFIEMFGRELNRNLLLKETCIKGPQNGFYKKDAEINGTIPIIKMKQLFANDTVSEARDCDKVSLTKKELMNFKLTSSDLLFGRRSLVVEGAGKCRRVGHMDKDMIFESSLLRITLNEELLIPRFLQIWFETEEGKSSISSIRSVTTIAGIKGSDLAKIKVPTPPISLQESFLDFVAQVDKSKLAIQQSLDELETLKKSLMQQYFG